MSPELSLEELEIRSDVILGRLLGHDLSYNAIEIGQAGPNEDAYENFLKEWQGQDRKDWQIINSAGNVGLISAEEISAIATQTKPDLLVVDGIYQMSLPSHARSIWEGAEANVYSLKNVAVQNNCLVVITHQTNREGAKAEGVPSHTDVAHGYGVNRGLDYLLALGQSDVSPLAREIGVPLRRNGEPISETFSIQFDADKGIIGDTASVDIASFSLMILISLGAVVVWGFIILGMWMNTLYTLLGTLTSSFLILSFLGLVMFGWIQILSRFPTDGS